MDAICPQETRVLGRMTDMTRVRGFFMLLLLILVSSVNCASGDITTEAPTMAYTRFYTVTESASKSEIVTEAPTIAYSRFHTTVASRSGGAALDVRLVNGTNNATGRVEVYYNGAWGTICDDGWDLKDAHVVCRMLGFSKAWRAPVQAAYGQGSEESDILLDEVECTGEEGNLADCRKNSFGVHDCNHNEDAGVICQDSTGEAPMAYTQYYPETDSGSGGAPLKVRLVNGTNNATGRVEVEYNGIWGTICDDGWDLNDANVVCTMLGFVRASSAPVQAAYGPGSEESDILLDEVDCTGEEKNITDCRKNSLGDHDCSHEEDAGVICTDADPDDYVTWSWSAIDIDWPIDRPVIWIPSPRGTALEVRLVGGQSEYEGRVEIQYNGTWGTICDDGWDLNDANVVCRMLGFFKASGAPVLAAYGRGSGESADILLDEVDCTGAERSLEDCKRNIFGEHNCVHAEDAGVICTESIPVQVRLVDGPNNNTGRVEVSLGNNVWGTICDDDWDARDANVVCTMLGFFGAAYAPVRATFGEGIGNILLRNVECTGTETNLGTCFHDIPEQYECAHDEDAGAACLVLIPDFSWNSSSSLHGNFELDCPDLTSRTDKGLMASSTVDVAPQVSSIDNRNLSVGCTYTSNDLYPYGDTWVACVARNAEGNYVTCNFTVSVKDEEAPTLNCPDLISTTDQGRRTSSTITIDPDVSDNTDWSPSVACSHYSGDVFQFGDTNVTCNATDDSGNIGTCTFKITIQDNEPPSLECDDQTFTADQGPITLSITQPISDDNVDLNPRINCTPTSIDGSQLGGTSITCQAEDSSGNTADCRFLFTVQDPCQVSNPCVHGRCSYEGSGQYRCDCHERYEGTHCDVKRKPIPALVIDLHPENQTAEIGNTVRLRCNFLHKDYFEWFRNGHPLPSTRNNNTLTIQSVSARHIGYYFCRGHGKGRRPQILDTMVASLYVKGVTNIQISGLKYKLALNGEISDSTSALYHEISTNISEYVHEGLDNNTELHDLSPSVFCHSLIRQEGVIVGMNVYIMDNNDRSASEEEHLVSQALHNMANTANSLIDVSNVVIKNTAICRNLTWTSPRFGLVVHFLEGENGTSVNSTGASCPFNTTNAGQPIGRAECVGDLISQSTWLPEDNCGSFRNVTDLLNELSEVPLSENNTVEVTEKISVVTSNTANITSNDIASVADIVKEITDISQNDTSSNNEKVAESFVAIASNLAKVDTETLEQAEEQTRSVTTILNKLEDQIKNIKVTNSTNLNFKQPEVAVKVQSVPKTDIENGLVLSVAGDSLSDLTKSNTTIQTSDDENNDAGAAQPETIAVVNIPNDVTSAISSAAKGNTTIIFIRVIFTVFASPALFISKSLQNRSSAGTNRSANTPVISLSIGDKKIENLTTSINFTFTPREPGYQNPTCVFWDENYHGELDGDWSAEGCKLLSVQGLRSTDRNKKQQNTCDPPSPPPPPSDEKIVCGCDHLTNFAVLMDVYKEDRPSDQAYKFLTYIGCGISILSLLVTLVTYLSNRVLRDKQTNQIFICLCLTLLSLYLSFIVMMSLDTARRQCEIDAVPCGFITGFVHYFALSSIAWMGVEGYNTYLIIVKIFDTYIQRFMLKAGAIAWGVPALIVIVTGVAAGENYAHEKMCFLELKSQIGGLLIPMSIILIFNVAIFALVIRQLRKSSNVAGRARREAKVERRENIERVQNAICILLLLGLTWISGYFLLIKSFSQVVEPIFIILNSFQGLFIFLLYCVRKPLVRKQWGLTCLDSVKKQDTTTSSGTHSSKNMSLSVATTSSTMPHGGSEKKSESIM